MKITNLLLGLPALPGGDVLLPDGLVTPQHPPHLDVAEQHDQQGQGVGQREVEQVVAKEM